MPQIWMTDEEAGELLGCSADQARATSIARDWARKRSRDGASRLKLPDAEAASYLDRLVQKRIDALLASSTVVRNLQEQVRLAQVDGRKAA